MSESEDDLLTIKDAVTHIARSTRHSRANSGDKLDHSEPASTSSTDQPGTQAAAEGRPPSSRVTFEDPGHLGLPTTSSLPNLATARPTPSISREAHEVSGSATERSESSEAWSEERVRQLEEDKAAIERLWGEHAQENDIGVLKFKLVCLLAVLPASLWHVSYMGSVTCFVLYSLETFQPISYLGNTISISKSMLLLLSVLAVGTTQLTAC